MGDIFDNKILCNGCGKEMKNGLVSRNGFNLRVKRCDKCNEVIVHPADGKEYGEFERLKKKDFEVKMRMVGNSYAVSIPREIVDFMREQERMMDDMVKLSFEKAGRLSLAFNMSEDEDDEDDESHVVSAREVRVVRNGKPVIHARKFTDSKHPERNRTQVIKNEEDLEQEEEE
ncbi:MAG: hypothetical protein NUV97_00050 [archaeon]|nr:hypothetical protein [archaeon]MCR4323391.1 hypothetical protein [Nanoarchaeota archaeon]